MLNKLFTFFYVVVLIISCNTIKIEEKVVSIDNFKKATLDNAQCTGVAILKTFPSKLLCGERKNLANLYICKKLITNDTIYVFELCQKVPEFALDKNFNENVCIMKEDVKSNVPPQVTIFVDNQLIIPDNAKYIFASLTRIID